MVEKVYTLNTDFNKWWNDEGQGLFASSQRGAVHKIYLQGLNKTWEAKEKFIKLQDELIKKIYGVCCSDAPVQSFVITIKKLIHNFNE